MLKSCRVCGLTQEHDQFPKMNVQYGRQYYRGTCASCTYKIAKTYTKNPSKCADVYIKRGLKQPGRPKLEYKPCAMCGVISHRDLFPKWAKRVSSYCKPCSNLRDREGRKKRKEQPAKKEDDRFVTMMNAFRPQPQERD